MAHSRIWLSLLGLCLCLLSQVPVVQSDPTDCEEELARRLLSFESTSADDPQVDGNDNDWQAFKTRCADMPYDLYIYAENVGPHVQLMATPAVDASLAVFRNCYSVQMHDTMSMFDDASDAEKTPPPGKVAIVMDDPSQVEMMRSEGLHLPPIGETKTHFAWTDIAFAFEMAWSSSQSSPEGSRYEYNILHNCCANFVMDAMSYAGADAQVDAMVGYFVHRWVNSEGSVLDNHRNNMVDLLPQEQDDLLWRTLFTNVLGEASDETLVSLIVKYYMQEHYDPHKANESSRAKSTRSTQNAAELVVRILKKESDKDIVADNVVEKLQGSILPSASRQMFLQRHRSLQATGASFLQMDAFWDSIHPQSESEWDSARIFYANNDAARAADGRFQDEVADAWGRSCGNTTYSFLLSYERGKSNGVFSIIAEPSSPSREECLSSFRFQLLEPATKEIQRLDGGRKDTISYFDVGRQFPLSAFLAAFDFHRTNNDAFDIVDNSCAHLLYSMMCFMRVDATVPVVTWGYGWLQQDLTTSQLQAYFDSTNVTAPLSDTTALLEQWSAFLRQVGPGGFCRNHMNSLIQPASNSVGTATLAVGALMVVVCLMFYNTLV